MADKTDVVDEAKLRELAEASQATWEGTVEDGGHHWFTANSLTDTGMRDDEDAAFIAAASPAVIIELLDNLSSARQAARRWQNQYDATQLASGREGEE